VKCPDCGAENPDWKRICGGCAKVLPEGPRPAEKGSSSAGGAIEASAVSTKMKLDYLHGIADPTQRRLDGVQALLAHFRRPQMDIDALLKDAVNMISRQMGIDGVAIGLRDQKDGLYRYKAMAGFRPDAVEALRRIAYRKEQFYEDPEYHGTDISKQSRLYLAEDNVIPAGDQNSFNRPALLKMKRTSLAESLEGDYIDVKILGPFDELLGWIEISGTRTMKLPDIASIKCVEIVASIVGAAVALKAARG